MITHDKDYLIVERPKTVKVGNAYAEEVTEKNLMELLSRLNKFFEEPVLVPYEYNEEQETVEFVPAEIQCRMITRSVNQTASILFMFPDPDVEKIRYICVFTKYGIGGTCIYPGDKVYFMPVGLFIEHSSKDSNSTEYGTIDEILKKDHISKQELKDSKVLWKVKTFKTRLESIFNDKDYIDEEEKYFITKHFEGLLETEADMTIQSDRILKNGLNFQYQMVPNEVLNSDVGEFPVRYLSPVTGEYVSEWRKYQNDVHTFLG